MSVVDLVVRGRRVVLPDGVRAASVHVANGRIAKIDAYDAFPPGPPVEDAGDALVLPGLVDTHVHINDPGRSDWEGFETATRAAAAGGVTTLVDMPLNSIPATTSVSALEEKARAAGGRLTVDVAFSGGLVPASVGELGALKAAGVRAFKCFLTESGVAEFPHVEERELEAGMRVIAELGVPLLVHAELSGPIDAVLRERGNLTPGEARRYIRYLESRPREAEDQAVALVARLAKRTGAHVHVVHLSSADAVRIIRDARDGGATITAETCPHYLSLAAEDIPDGATAYKCAPPIRERENQVRLWRALDDGIIAQVVTDHSPSSPGLKCVDSGDFSRAWGGIASLQLGLPVVFTEARARGRSIEDIVRWMCAATAELVGLAGRKGSIAVGRDADLLVFDDTRDAPVVASSLHHRHKLTPYQGKTLRGVVETTFLRGRRIYSRGQFSEGRTGEWLR